MNNPDWTNYPNFTANEFICQCGCGQNKISPELLNKLQDLRTRLNMPLTISSGYRCPNHSAERHKTTKGTHTMGLAADIEINSGKSAYQILNQAIGHFNGIGIKRVSGGGGFIHLDIATVKQGKVRPTIWTY